jgi:hypothetical protein
VTPRDVMGEFFERLGHKIVRSANGTWYDVQPNVMFSYPYYKLISPSEDELRALVEERKLFAIRFPTSIDKFGFISNRVINTNKNYDFSSMHQKARNQTRRAMENCKVEQIEFDYLRIHGLALNEDTAKRQGRESQYAYEEYWQKYCMAAKAVDGVSAWGAFVDDRLAAFLIAVEADDWVEWIVNHSSTELRNRYPNNALAFVAAQYYFQKKNCNGICYGLGSLEATPELDHFKERMGWVLDPIKQRIVFSKKIGLVTNIAQEPVLKLLSVIFPKSYKVRKTSAMIRYYRKQTFDVPNVSDTHSSD